MPIFRCPSSSSLSSSASSCSDQSSSSSYGDDYPHPLGFSRYGIDDDSDDESDGVDPIRTVMKPVTDAREPTRLPSARENELALHHSLTRSIRQRQFDAGLDDITNNMERIAALVKCADVIVNDATQTKFIQNQCASLSKLELLANVAAQQDRKIDVWIQEERAKMERDREEVVQALQMLIDRDQNRADAVLAQQNADAREATRVSEDAARATELKEEEERARLEAKAQAEAQAEQAHRVREEADVAKRAEIQAAKQKALQFQTDAQELVSKLVTTRASIAPFEKSKAVSKRRLQIKKVVKGKLNTLQHNAIKVNEVSTEIVQALQAAKLDDGHPGPEDLPEAKLGFMYFLDLLASNVIVRASATTFDSSGGEGFPLANCVALIAAKVPELSIILSAHIYAVCPAVIPMLPQVKKNASDDEFMCALGMKKDAKTGDFETFPRFLNRTEGLISISAAIMCCSYSSDVTGGTDNEKAKTLHVLLGGQEGALNWLKRFLNLLPLNDENDSSTLPLITAPVLTSFLTVAGCMLIKMYPNEFMPLWRETIVKRVLPRLDQGIGAPSALRLDKLVKDVNGFQSLPKGAIAELYVMNATSAPPPAQIKVASSGGTSRGFANMANSSSFPSSGNASNNPFDTNHAQTNAGSTSDHFNYNSNPFAPPPTTAAATSQSSGGWNSSSNQQSSPFGPSTTTNMALNSNSNSNSNPFSAQPTNPSPFAASNNAPSPFAATSANTATTTSFGPSSSSVSNPFGANSSNNNGFAAPSPFGTSQNTANNDEFNTSNHGGGSRGRGKQPPLCRFFAQGRCRAGNACKFSHDTGNNQNQNQNDGNSWSIPISDNSGGKSNNNPFGRGGW